MADFLAYLFGAIILGIGGGITYFVFADTFGPLTLFIIVALGAVAFFMFGLFFTIALIVVGAIVAALLT